LAGIKRCIPRKKRCDKVVDCLHADDEEDCGFSHYDFYRAANDTPSPLLSPGSTSRSAGYRPFKPAVVNEPVQPKEAEDDVTKVVDSVNQVVSSVQSSTKIEPTQEVVPKPSHPTATAPPPASTLIPVVFPGPKDVPKPTSFPPPPEPLDVDAEKAGPPAAVGEPLAPKPTEQVHPPPEHPIDGQDLVPSESDAGKKPTPPEQGSAG